MNSDCSKDDCTKDGSPTGKQGGQRENLQQGSDLPKTAASTDSQSAEKALNTNVQSRTAGDGWAHDEQPPMTGPCRVDYCSSRHDLGRIRHDLGRIRR